MKRLNLSKVNFTENSDLVEPGMTIFNPEDSDVRTGKGADLLIGTSSIYGDFGFGVLVEIAAEDLNSIIVSAEHAQKARVSTEAIKNRGIIRTNLGADVISGTTIANLSTTVGTVSQALAIVNTLDTNVITEAFASIKFKATADGIDNYKGKLHTNWGSDTLDGDTTGSVAAVATAVADASAIVEAIALAPMSEGLQAFAAAMATSLAQATITAKGINNKEGIITTGMGKDTISASATSSAGTFADTLTSSLTSATPENQALATATANAWAEASDTAIGIDNSGGLILTGIGGDTISANAQAKKKAIAIDNSGGYILTGLGGDTISANAQANAQAIAIDNSGGHIESGNGPDTIMAKASGFDSYGIFGGIIRTGEKGDRVTASSFGGGVNIDMGGGDDLLGGYGEAEVHGGEGFDTVHFDIHDLGFSYKMDDFNRSFGANNGVNFHLDGITMTTTGFEQFIFADGMIYTYEQLTSGI
jgi:hypothetical protein